MSSNTYGRQVVIPMTNKSGGGVIAGDVVIVSATAADSFTTTTSAAFTGLVGIAQETIANNATGRVLISGYAPLVNVAASVTILHYGATHTVAKQAASAGASRGVGTFCQFLTGGTTPDAVVYPVDLLGSSLTNPMTTKGDIIQADTGGTPTRLGAGTSGQVLTSGGAAAFSAWATPGAGVTGAMNQLAANVTMTTTGTFYDGPALTLAAGTYFMSGTVTIDANDAATTVTAKLWNGTTVLSSVESLSYGGAAGRKFIALHLEGYKVLGGTETWKISVVGNNGQPATILKATTDNGAGDNASTLVALKIA